MVSMHPGGKVLSQPPTPAALVLPAVSLFNWPVIITLFMMSVCCVRVRIASAWLTYLPQEYFVERTFNIFSLFENALLLPISRKAVFPSLDAPCLSPVSLLDCRSICGVWEMLGTRPGIAGGLRTFVDRECDCIQTGEWKHGPF